MAGCTGARRRSARGALDAFRPRRAEILTLHQSPALTVMNVVWTPGMRFPPHDHRTWAQIAVYAGREDNTFYRRVTTDAPALAATGGATLQSGEVAEFDDQLIHAVHNPSVGFTAAIHVYGGDYPSLERSLWDDDGTAERPSNSAESAAYFARANDALS